MSHFTTALHISQTIGHFRLNKSAFHSLSDVASSKHFLYLAISSVDIKIHLAHR